MGAEHSRPTAEHHLSWQTLRFGFKYAPSDVAVWPQYAGVAQWLTAEDARRLRQQLRCRTKGNLLTLSEFHAWLMNDSRVLQRQEQSESTVPQDITTPPPPPNGASTMQSSTAPSATVLDLHMAHMFRAMQKKVTASTKVHALEFLAASIVVSRAIWSLEEKICVLTEVFQEPAGVGRLRQSDIALLVFCAMEGVGKMTVGIATRWYEHCIDAPTVAKAVSSECMAFASNALDDTGAARAIKSLPTQQWISVTEFHTLVLQKEPIRRFLSLFAGEELRNPFTFGSLRSMCTGVALDSQYRDSVGAQTQLYEQLLGRCVTFEGRIDKRRQHAATLVQSTWRRRCSEAALQQRKREQIRLRHAKARTLQQFLKQRQLAKVLALHAMAEREALNGGVLVAGSGPCVPRRDVDPRAAAPACRNGLLFVDTFKFQSIRIATVTMSKSYVLALEVSRQELYGWGRCLPCVYEDDEEHMRLLQPTPARLAYRFPASAAVAEMALGASHAAIVDTDGMVYTWGFNDHGQLGHGAADVLKARTGQQYSLYYDERNGRVYEYLSTPTRLIYFEGAAEQDAEPIPIQKLCCGDYYVLALSRAGDVFSWGEASEGQLGHGEAHDAFRVGFVDVSMLNSAFTFLGEPEPILMLSNERVCHIACRNNHSIALTEDFKLFEWGSWGKRTGHDQDHTLVPVETDESVRNLRLRDVSVGDHHMLAEGASVSLRVGDGDESVPLSRATQSCSLDTIEHLFGGNDSTFFAVFLDLDVDDVEEVFNVDDEQGGDGIDVPPSTTKNVVEGVESVWKKRVAPSRLSLHGTSMFDYQLRHFAGQLGWQERFHYQSLLTCCVHGHVDDRVVVLPWGRAPGHYLQLLLEPHELSDALFMPEVDHDDRSSPSRRKAIETTAASIPMVEFRVCVSTNAQQWIGKRGFGTHLCHPSLRPASKKRKAARRHDQRRLRLEENSVFIIELDPTALDPSVLERLDASYQDENGEREPPDLAVSSEVIAVLVQQVLMAQEAGALAVLVVLDLFDAEAFELPLDQDTGVYIPVMMISATAIASFDYLLHVGGASGSTSGRKFRDVLNHVLELCDSNEDPRVVPVRCFERVDTLPSRIGSAFASGARGVVVEYDNDRNTRLLPRATDSFTDRLLASISHDQGQKLRAAGRLAVTTTPMIIPPRRVGATPMVTEANCELVVEAAVDIRAGGTTYAWGSGENGRLGVGNTSLEPFDDGYEALTDSVYRFVGQPMAIAALDGVEMTQLVAASAHSLAVTAQGRVFSWGRGTRGELGHSRMLRGERVSLLEDVDTPRLVQDVVTYERVVKVDANDAATMLVTETVMHDEYRRRRREIAHLRALTLKSTAA
ncbi:TPA: hypothetical protein N0F65_004240 [Lagenidium giganteum]|uniref:Uncharacterized protein n=1 Tax=Lagenidium giganteum TaxID=4803 RepID=A0AAV2ZBJ0_9STRA|nr:TPA: hypothetical protein N0F65_004240 [Lagenidium giganteum]